VESIVKSNKFYPEDNWWKSYRSWTSTGAQRRI